MYQDIIIVLLCTLDYSRNHNNWSVISDLLKYFIINEILMILNIIEVPTKLIKAIPISQD